MFDCETYIQKMLRKIKISDETFTGNDVLRIDFLQPAKRRLMMKRTLWAPNPIPGLLGAVGHICLLFMLDISFLYPFSLMFLQCVITRNNPLGKWHPQFLMGQETAETEMQNGHYVILYQWIFSLYPVIIHSKASLIVWQWTVQYEWHTDISCKA